MDQITEMPLDRLQVIAGERGLDIETLAKDYYLTALLYSISKIGGLYFKGGTAPYKIYLNHLRLSEDLDFTVKGDVEQKEQEIRAALKGGMFERVTHDKKTKEYTRLLAHYTSPYGRKDHLIIDLNSKAKLVLPPEEKEIQHFYAGYLPQFTVKTLNLKELVAEKIRSIVQRYAPRDYFDAYQIIKHELPVDKKLLEKKFQEAGQEFDIERIFKRGSKIYNKWDTDLSPLTIESVTFDEVIQTLAEYFKYKEYKAERKKKKQLA